jgi:hypothetical protein
MGGTGSHTRCRSRLIRYPDAPRNRSTRGKPPRDGVGTGFRTLLSFQGTSPGCSSVSRSRFPRHDPSPERRGRYHGPVEIVKDFPPAPERTPCGVPPATSTPSHRSAAPRPDLLSVGTATEAVGRILLAFGDPLSSVADAAGVVPERSSVLKNFPAYSPVKVAPRATPCQLTDSSNDNGSSVTGVPGRLPGRPLPPRVPFIATVPASWAFPGRAPGPGMRRPVPASG